MELTENGQVERLMWDVLWIVFVLITCSNVNCDD